MKVGTIVVTGTGVDTLIGTITRKGRDGWFWVKFCDYVDEFEIHRSQLRRLGA